MSGFKASVLKGGLVEFAVAFIMATAFTAVVDSFVELLTSLLPLDIFQPESEGTLGPFINAVISFVVIAAVIYFLVVVPYTRAKERFFPELNAPKTDLGLLQEILDELQAQRRNV